MSKIRGKFAATYDDFVKRNSLLPGGLEKIVKESRARDILEFGTGTGTVAVGLTLKGLDVTGVDLSPDMLDQARRKAKKYRAKLKLVEGDIIDVRLEKQFDMILCLGNTLPLILSLAKSRKLFANCYRHLKPGGGLIFQMLNYDRILKTRPATFATDVSENSIRIKQYKYHPCYIDFVVSLVDTATIPPRITTRHNKIRPWTKKELTEELKNAGFYKIQAFGDYRQNRFNLKSKDLIIYCRKR